MVIDKQTLKDLEIFKASEDGLSIFDLLDKTITSGGKYILEQKFKKPLASISQILQVQDAIAYLSENNDNWMLPFSDSTMKSLENYASSNIDPIKDVSKFNLFLKGIIYFFNDRYIFFYLRESLIEIINYINKFISYFVNYGKQTPPALISDLANCFKVFSEIVPVNILSDKISKRKKLSFTEVFYYDGLLRGDLIDKLVRIIESAYELDALLSMCKSQTF